METLRIVCCLRIDHSQVAASVLRGVEKREVLLRSRCVQKHCQELRSIEQSSIEHTSHTITQSKIKQNPPASVSGLK
jgi:hypothetical protein